MELNIQNSPLTYLKCVLQEVRRQEETAETVVPDTYPDIAAILDSNACAVIRGKDCRMGSLTISGGVKGGILYRPEDGSWPRCLEFYIPFSLKFENPSLTEQAQVLSDVRVTAVDGRMINSRKALLRVNLSCCITAYERAEETLYALGNVPEFLRLRQMDYAVELPLETAERSFLISDTLEIPAGNPAVEQLCKLNCQLELTDQKLVGNKAVFKGLARCKMLYQSEDHNLYVQEFQLPFSQYCELTADYDEDEQVELLPVITGYDLELESPSDARKGYLNIHALIQCVVHGKRRFQAVQDAYCTQGTLQPVWQEFSLSGTLDRPQTTQTVRHHIAGEFRQVLDCDTYADHPMAARSQDAVVINVPVSLHILGYDQNGAFCAAVGKESGSYELPLAENAQCLPRLESVGNTFVSSASDGVDARTEITIRAACTAGQAIRALAAGTLEGENVRNTAGPSVILRRAKKGSNLWDIAKAAVANEETLRQANGLEGEQLSEDRVLLIPVG